MKHKVKMRIQNYHQCTKKAIGQIPCNNYVRCRLFGKNEQLKKQYLQMAYEDPGLQMF